MRASCASLMSFISVQFVEGSQARLLPLRRLCIVVHSSAFACALYENVITEVKIFTSFSPASVAKAVPVAAASS